MRIREYDDGFDSAASFEAAGADRPEDCEDPLDRWEMARLHFELDDSFQYSEADMLGFIRQYDDAMSRLAAYDAPPIYSTDEWLRIARNMSTYGGSFCHHISEAMLVADSGNRERLSRAFPELLVKYADPAWDTRA